MTHVFLLMVYLGKIIVSKDMHFKDMNDCLYFARALTDQPAVPNANALEGNPKFVKYVSVCKPVLVNPQRVKIY
jgi:hypothetical protein